MEIKGQIKLDIHTLKRYFDVIAVMVGMVVMAPVIFITAVVMAIATRSFPLFRQERIGKGGISFMILKVKTMTDERDRKGHLLPEEQRTPLFGKFVRKVHLDELPQLVNILSGEMSVVGPRPFLSTETVIVHDSMRQLVRPGLTGLAQISGNNNLPRSEVLRLDHQYVNYMLRAPLYRALAEDLRIVAMTPFGIVRHFNSPHFRPADHTKNSPDQQVGFGQRMSLSCR